MFVLRERQRERERNLENPGEKFYLLQPQELNTWEKDLSLPFPIQGLGEGPQRLANQSQEGIPSSGTSSGVYTGRNP